MPSEPGLHVTLVAAVADNGVIGADGGIPWQIPEDFAHFKRLTLGHTLVMGRATYDSIGRPLPGRTTIVLTRDPLWAAEGVLAVPSLEAALTMAGQVTGEVAGEVMVAGGSTVYAAALPLADAQVLTEVHQSPAGDTFYPNWDRSEWVEVRREPGPGLDWVWWERARVSASPHRVVC